MCGWYAEMCLCNFMRKRNLNPNRIILHGDYEFLRSTVLLQDIDCGVSIRSMTSDKQQWSFSLYNFEDNGRISKEVRVQH